VTKPCAFEIAAAGLYGLATSSPSITRSICHLAERLGREQVALLNRASEPSARRALTRHPASMGRTLTHPRRTESQRRPEQLGLVASHNPPRRESAGSRRDGRGRAQGSDRRERSLFRSVNEKIEDVSLGLSLATQNITAVCECGDLKCAEHLDIDLTTYEQIRSDPTWFVVVSGHEIADVEEIVERHDGFDIVCKHKGLGEDVAIAADPRS
jgi:hypothetical protein